MWSTSLAHRNKECVCSHVCGLLCAPCWSSTVDTKQDCWVGLWIKGPFLKMLVSRPRHSSGRMKKGPPLPRWTCLRRSAAHPTKTEDWLQTVLVVRRVARMLRTDDMQPMQQATPAPAVPQQVTSLTQVSLPMTLDTASWWCFESCSFDEHLVRLIRYAPEKRSRKRSFHIILIFWGQFLPDPTVKPAVIFLKEVSGGLTS